MDLRRVQSCSNPSRGNSAAYRFVCVLVVIAISVLGAGCNNSLFLERHDIAEGKISGFETGMDKPAVLAAARELGVTIIEPEIKFSKIFNYRNASELSFAKDDGIWELTTSSGVDVIYEFDQGFLSALHNLSDNEPPTYLKLGVSSSTASEILKPVLLKDRVALIGEQFKESLDQLLPIEYAASKTNTLALETYDIWSFEVTNVKPAGAYFTLFFTAGALSRIRYRRPRLQIDL